MNDFTFIKEHTGRWYIVLPEWTGSKADLEMVQGADTMLDKVSNGKKEVTLTLSEQPFEGAELLTLIEDRTDEEGGGIYILKAYNGEEINHRMWLCKVTLFVFNKLPQIIYFKVQEHK